MNLFFSFHVNNLLIGLIWQALFVIYSDRDYMLLLLVTQSLLREWRIQRWGVVPIKTKQRR